MKDYYGRTFNKEDIKNSDFIGFYDSKTLDDFSEDEINRLMVLITDKINGDRLYLLTDLEQMLKANYYCRLEDPYTKNDILEQVPDFKPALEFEEHAAHYNALILDKNPDFIPLLKTYVQEILNKEDSYAFADTAKNDISANKSLELDKFYSTIANFPREKKNDFDSLFIINRRPYKQGELWTFPAKWELDETNKLEQYIYNFAINNNYYKPFPHRNVLIADLIKDPEDACMHSWGMDVLYLLLHYHIGTNKPFLLFDRNTNKASFKMEMELRYRIEQDIMSDSLDSLKGHRAHEEIKNTVTNKLLLKLERKCTNYMDYLLKKAGVEKRIDYPSPIDLENRDSVLVKKYTAVYEMYSALKTTNPNDSDIDRITEFTKLFNEKERQETIAQHRDNLGIRFLSLVSSLLTFGVKNLISYYSTGGYCGFWNSRGATLNNDISTILESFSPPEANL